MLTPITSNEMYLAKLCGMDVDVPNPITRMEMYLAKLCGMKIDIPTPIARVDLYLAKLCGMNVVVPEPITRLEQYMAKLCGMNVVVPEPITREEYYWRIYSDFREYTGALPIVIASRSGGTLRNYRIYGNSVQDGVPTPEEPIEVQSVGDKTVNLFDAGSAELGKEIVGDTIVPSSYWFVSDYIPVHTGTLYAVNMGIGNLGAAILAYTSKKSKPKRPESVKYKL